MDKQHCLQFLCNLNFLKNFTCSSGKFRTEFTNQIAKSTSPRLSQTTFFAHSGFSFKAGCFIWLFAILWQYFDANIWGFFNFFFNIIIVFYLMSNSWTYLISWPCSFFFLFLLWVRMRVSFYWWWVVERVIFPCTTKKKLRPVLSERCPLLYITVEPCMLLACLNIYMSWSLFWLHNAFLKYFRCLQYRYSCSLTAVNGLS